jgi:hypothetical protein
MSEITHVVVQLEPQRESPTTFRLVAEAGYPDVDDVVSVVEYGPVELAPADPASSLNEDDLLAVLTELSEALKDEAGIVISVEELRTKTIIQARGR